MSHTYRTCSVEKGTLCSVGNHHAFVCYHPVAQCNGLAVRYTLSDSKGFISEEVTIHSLLPVKRDVGWCVAGPGCGHRVNVDLYGWAILAQEVLNVNEAYPSRSQAFIFALLSGLQGNGSSEGSLMELLS